MVKWIGKFSLLLKRLRDAWMSTGDFLCSPEQEKDTSRWSSGSASFLWLLKRLRDAWIDLWKDRGQRTNADVLDPNGPETQDKWHATQVRNHEKLSPFNDDLTTLMFIVARDLTEAQ